RRNPPRPSRDERAFASARQRIGERPMFFVDRDDAPRRCEQRLDEPGHLTDEATLEPKSIVAATELAARIDEHRAVFDEEPITSVGRIDGHPESRALQRIAELLAQWRGRSQLPQS